MLYSVIIPVYNSAKIVQKTIAECRSFFIENGLDWELFLINDGSTDTSWQIIKEHAQKNDNIYAINLLKNYGQHRAVYTGLIRCNGDYAITMDDDLQNPPDQIAHLITKIEKGHDVVFGDFFEKKHSLYRKIGSKIINYLNYKIFDKPKDLILTNFRIIRKDVIDRLKSFNTNYPYIPGLLLIHSSNPANTQVSHKPRRYGSSNYTIWKIIKLVSVILINYSSYPLRFVGYVGLTVSLASFCYGLFSIIKYIFVGSQVQGWTTLVVLMSFFNGVCLIMLGLMGEYLSRILNQISLSNQLFIKEVVGINED